MLTLGLCSIPFTPADAKAKARPTPFRVTIEAVSAGYITISQKDGPHTYKITRDTEITYKNDTVTARQLHPGMSVQVTADAADDAVAGLIQSDDPPPRPIKKK